MVNRRLGIPLATVVVAAVTLVPSAQADTTCAANTTCATTVNFAVNIPGVLSITVPDGPVNIGSGNPGTTISGQLSPITVSDQRAALNAIWAASVSTPAGGFTTGGGTAAETIPASAVSYWSGPATATSGTGTFVPGQVNAGAAQTLSTVRTAFSKTTGSGSNSATWNPTVVVNVPAQAVSGTYTGTINHSVA